MPNNLSPDEEAVRLAASAQDVELRPAVPPLVQANGPVWRLVDQIGPLAVPVALGFMVGGFALSAIGPEWAGASLLYVVALLALLIYIPALLRAKRREDYQKAFAAHARQEAARTEVARLVLEQHQREKERNRDRDNKL